MTTFLGFIDNPALPMALVIAGSAIASTGLNFLTLGPETGDRASGSRMRSARVSGFRRLTLTAILVTA